ncbi:MAG TPA: PilZ domain-containing protein [Sphingomicrobium sp.]|nr:PilZ domain-containing protein [Sphingomicrobium sp.]
MSGFAHFEDRPQEGERRRAPRRVMRLGLGAGGEAVTVRDISLTGMLLETSAAMLVGAGFEVELPHAGTVWAVVVWNSGEFYGCEFEHPISVAAVSAARLQSEPSTPETAGVKPPDPLSELRALNAEVEEISARLDRAIDRLSGK